MARGTDTDDTRLTTGSRPAGRPATGRRPSTATARRRLSAVRRRGRTVAPALAAGAVLTLTAGCGSATLAELPPPARPDRAPATTAAPSGELIAPTTARASAPQTRQRFRDGSLEAVLDPSARALTIVDAATGETRSRLDVGVGPTQVSCAPQGPCFVVDTQGDALLLVRVGEGGRGSRLTRRVYVAGAPYGIALDPERRRLWITLTARNELVELGAHGRPHILSRRPTIQQPDGVAVDPASGDVTITAPDGTRERIDDPATAAR